MAHIGAMRYLEERGIPIDAFAGTSIGSLIGGSFACGITSHDAEADMHDWMKTGPRKLIRPALSFRSLLAGKPLENICRDRFGSRHFIDLPTPMVAVAADLASGRSITLKTGRLARAVHASMSIPGMFPPVMIGPYVLVDGGVANPVPSDTLPELGADIRIVVNISYAPDDLDRWAREEGSTPPVRAIQGGRPPASSTPIRLHSGWLSLSAPPSRRPRPTSTFARASSSAPGASSPRVPNTCAAATRPPNAPPSRSRCRSRG